MGRLSPTTRGLIDGALRPILAPWGYAGFVAEVRTDSDGDPAVFIEARFDKPDTVPTSDATTRAMVAVADALRQVGDDRIPYLDYPFPPDPISGEAA